jgi:hypothetical protein
MASRKHSKKRLSQKKKSRSRSRSRGSKKSGSRPFGSRVSKALVGGGNPQAGRGPKDLAMMGGNTIEFFLWDQCGYCKEFEPIAMKYLSAMPIEANYIFTKVYGSSPIIPGIDIPSFPSVVASLPDAGISRVIPGLKTFEELTNVFLELGMFKVNNEIANNIVNGILPKY